MQTLISVFQANANELWATVFRIVANEDDARDCLQQTYLDASKMDVSLVRDWRAVLLRIATRRAIDVLRQRFRRKELVSSEIESAGQFAPDSHLRLLELRDAVRVCLADLPANQAEAFWLRHVEQHTTKEIGEALDITSENVRVLVHRAVVHLRKHLEPALVDSFRLETKR